MFAIVVDGITTFVWDDVLPNYTNWNSYIVTAFNWFNLWQMEWPLFYCDLLMLLPWWQIWKETEE